MNTTPLTDILSGANLNLGIAGFASEQDGGIEGWLNRPVLDGHGRVVTVDTRPSVDAHELVSF